MSPRSKPLHFAIAAGLAALAAPAFAADQPVTDADGRVYGDTALNSRPEWKPAAQAHAPRAAASPMAMPGMPPAPAATPMAQPGYDPVAFNEAKADWLYECRRRYSGKSGLTGSILGGVVGGVAGSAIAGRGNRTVGAVAGGALGAVAGAAIGNSADQRRARDYCESYLEDYLARQQPAGHFGQMQHGYTYGYAMQPVMMMVPVAMTYAAAPAAPKQDCKETTVIEEWVEVPRAKRWIPQRRVVPDKRVRIVPDKRVKTY